jgi:hypothetical protein
VARPSPKKKAQDNETLPYFPNPLPFLLARRAYTPHTQDFVPLLRRRLFHALPTTPGRATHHTKRSFLLLLLGRPPSAAAPPPPATEDKAGPAAAARPASFANGDGKTPDKTATETVTKNDRVARSPRRAKPLHDAFPFPRDLERETGHGENELFFAPKPTNSAHSRRGGDDPRTLASPPHHRTTPTTLQPPPLYPSLVLRPQGPILRGIPLMPLPHPTSSGPSLSLFAAAAPAPLRPPPNTPPQHAGSTRAAAGGGLPASSFLSLLPTKARPLKHEGSTRPFLVPPCPFLSWPSPHPTPYKFRPLARPRNTSERAKKRERRRPAVSCRGGTAPATQTRACARLLLPGTRLPAVQNSKTPP